MSNSSPNTSLNRSTSQPNDQQKLIIKAANQKYEDFIVEEFEMNWSIKHLKEHLTDNYPQKPDAGSIRLIYSGKILHDHWTLDECIRHNSEIKSHTIHLVLSATAVTKLEEKANASRLEEVSDIENELTPDTSSTSSSSSVSSSPSTPIVTYSNASHSFETHTPMRTPVELNTTFTVDENSNLTAEQKFKHIHSEYLRYYETMGISVQDNAWYSSYVQQLALYKYMYGNYLQSQGDLFQINPTVNVTNFLSQTVSSTPVNPSTSNQEPNSNRNANHPQQHPPNQNEEQPADGVQRDAQARPAPQAAAQPEGEREDDWLGLLHNAVSLIVLFSIGYYYSSLERFLIIFGVVSVLIIYHNGWLTLQRRQVQPRAPAPAENNENQETDRPNEETTTEGPQQAPESNNPNFFRLFFSFILTFFTSLIPERPRIPN